MTEGETKTSTKNVCDFRYLSGIMNGKKPLIYKIMDTFLLQIPKELSSIRKAITDTNYASIKSFAHTMKSSVSIMGISILTPVLKEMEDLGIAAVDIETIKVLNVKLNLICLQAMEEVEREKPNYI
jgi:HPt (histidine-containing phosphotransfer) domain-containing protein